MPARSQHDAVVQILVPSGKFAAKDIAALLTASLSKAEETLFANATSLRLSVTMDREEEPKGKEAAGEAEKEASEEPEKKVRGNQILPFPDEEEDFLRPRKDVHPVEFFMTDRPEVIDRSPGFLRSSHVARGRGHVIQALCAEALKNQKRRSARHPHAHEVRANLLSDDRFLVEAEPIQTVREIGGDVNEVITKVLALLSRSAASAGIGAKAAEDINAIVMELVEQPANDRTKWRSITFATTLAPAKERTQRIHLEGLALGKGEHFVVMAQPLLRAMFDAKTPLNVRDSIVLFWDTEKGAWGVERWNAPA